MMADDATIADRQQGLPFALWPCMYCVAQTPVPTAHLKSSVPPHWRWLYTFCCTPLVRVKST